MRLVACCIAARTPAWVPSSRPGCEEVARQDRLGLGAQELRPAVPGSTPRRGVDPGLVQDFPHRRRRHLHSQAGQLTMDPAVPPSGVLASQPQDQGP
jgi:hypothetical protein